MATITEDIRRTATDTGYAVVGITDLAVEQVRTARTKALQVRDGVIEGFAPRPALAKVESGVRKAQVTALQLPGTAVGGALEAASKVEEGIDELTERGRSLVTRIRHQRATQDLVRQGRTTLSRSKAAVTTSRRGTAATRSSVKATTTTARRQAEEGTKQSAAAARTSAARTQTAAKRTATTTRKRAAATRTANKSAATSARKSAAAATKATKAAASKVGD